MKTKLLLMAILCMGVVSCKERAAMSGSPETKSVGEVTPDERGYIVKVGDMAPDFDIEYLDGTVVKLSSLRGRLVMLQFTATWCSVCRKEMPHIEAEIWQKHKDNPRFALIGVDYKDDKETTAKFAEDMKITYPLTLDVLGTKFDLYAPGGGVTRNIIIDRTGKIIMLTRLFDEEEFNEMVKLIDNYIANEDRQGSC